MGTLWDQLLMYVRSRKVKPPAIRKDLWDAVEQLQELRAVTEQLAGRVEQLENELNHVRLQMSVLETHDQQRRRSRNG